MVREPVCGFCGQGDHDGPNGAAEKLVSCNMCGRSGHPICLGFKSSDIIKKIKSYDWCCMECKPCEQCRLQGDDVGCGLGQLTIESTSILRRLRPRVAQLLPETVRKVLRGLTWQTTGESPER